MGIGLTEVRQAIEGALDRLSRRYSILEDPVKREEFANEIHTAVAQALKSEMSKKEVDLAVVEEVLASMLEKLHGELHNEHSGLAEGIGYASGTIKKEIREHVTRILDEILGVKVAVRDVGDKVEDAKRSAQDIAYLKQRFGY
ncbi:hypothetical protein [Hydrogenivirga sp. 128-5-R1-1]|uniref:hypothetical protein n=1 Tax=Hydrogenivirga sp. 128-5-R1-1 TaxID=392423 RepID=UPI00015F392D|nr:hypothetical protein [Hydrogenivirga sp. 128-5-R1-1]EDP75082.1 hypothetical protein HG1285_14479 [Hydrogenivirga sp. 128-5-R1-1]